MIVKMPDTDIILKKVLLDRIMAKKERLDSERPLPKDALERLRQEIRLAHTYHSNAIEGSTLSLQETKLILEEGVTIGGKTLREHLEATGNADAFDLIEELARRKKDIDHGVVQEIHGMVTRGQLMDSGKYRTHNVRITGAKKNPPDFSKLVPLMDRLLGDIRKMKGPEMIVAALLHYRFVEIHPFSDGNGRVARLLSNLYLMRAGFPPIVLKKEDRKRYYQCLNKADGGNTGPFVNFVAKAVDEGLTLYLSIFGGKDELVPLRELATGTPYSQEYLSLRARQGAIDAIKMGKVWHSTRRALEEYIGAHRQGDRG